MVKYHIQREVATLPLSIYLLGFTIGPLAAAPLSEIYGRRPVYWSTLPLLMIFTAASGVSNSIALMTVMRLLAGIGGSGALAIGAGIFPTIDRSELTN
jgi:MFS family permease